ncbi:MAG: hypothetical protein AAF702_11695 [Chloroflexota bacterium]
MKNITSFMQSLPQNDPDNMFNMGVCRGAEVATFATAYDKRIKGLILSSPYVDAAESYLKGAGSAKNLRDTMLAQVAMAKQHYFATGEDIYIKESGSNKTKNFGSVISSTREIFYYVLLNSRS